MPGIVTSQGGIPISALNGLRNTVYGGTVGAAAGSGPAVATSPYTNNGNTGGGPGAAVSGDPGYGAISQAQSFVVDPNAANYTIDPAGSAVYRGDEGQVAQNFNSIYNQAGGFSAAQGAIGNQQNTDFQNNLNASTAQFLGNAQGLGNYNSGLASQGQAQQQGAYNDISNLAAGNGPSLAGKNLQAGLNSENQAIQAQAMTNQGLNGAGNTQRNLLNAQAANANNFAQAGGQASVAEQLGALGQESSAAANLRSANQAQASAASSAGLAQRSQNASALATQYGNQLAGNAQQNSNAAQAANLGLGFQTQAATGASNAYGNQYQTYVNQQQRSEDYDTAQQNTGNTRANINIAAQQSEAGQQSGGLTTLGNGLKGAATIATTKSDENIKTDIMQGDNADASVDDALNAIASAGYQGPSVKTGSGNLPDFANSGLKMDKAATTSQEDGASQIGQSATSAANSSGGSGLAALLGIGGSLVAASLPYIVDGAKSAWNGVESGASAVGNGIADGAEGAWHGIEDGADTIGNGAKSAWNWVTSW